MQIKIHVFEKVVPGNVIPASTIELKRGNAETKDSEHKNRILLRILNILFQYINIMHEKRLMSFLKNTSICFKYVILHTHIMWSYYLCCRTKNPTARNLLSSGDYSIPPEQQTWANSQIFLVRFYEYLLGLCQVALPYLLFHLLKELGLIYLLYFWAENLENTALGIICEAWMQV